MLLISNYLSILSIILSISKRKKAAIITSFYVGEFDFTKTGY